MDFPISSTLPFRQEIINLLVIWLRPAPADNEQTKVQEY